MVLRTGRYGKFVACSTYPKCDHVINLDKDGNKLPPKEPPVKTDKECPKCKPGMLLIRKSRKGEKCKYTSPMELNLNCPEENCEGDLDHTRIGRRRAIACSKCEFQAYGNVDKSNPCEKCGNSWTLVKNKTKKKPTTITCPKTSCAHVVEEFEEIEAGAEEAAVK
ncbi:MAG TPA: hypothetical protein EYO31_08280 [Phycisphaerales bacterium]|nr:hypothetical protein [Phycisphaerales bacterium]